jgi:mannose-6-phosphate isomerase-like protein (cupin superfamily)
MGKLPMEPQPGVFVADPLTDAWELDPDVGGLTQILCHVPGVWAGFNRYDTAPAPVHWTPPERETFMILEGAARIEIAGGATLDLKAGDVASLPAGTETTWHITAPFREFWVISGPSIDPEGTEG